MPTRTNTSIDRSPAAPNRRLRLPLSGAAALVLGTGLAACSGGSASTPPISSSPKPAALAAAKASPGPAQAREVTLLHIADTHAQLETHTEYVPGASPELRPMGGFARLRTVLDRMRREAPGAAFVVDGGDTFQGSGPAAWSKGGVVIEPFNALGVDVCVPGNWEVVYGPDRFRELMGAVRCKVLSINFHATDTGKRLFDPAVTLEREGVRVAFVGITDPTTSKRQPPAQVRGLDTTRLDGLREVVRELDGKADLVVAVTHAGLALSRQIAREIPELDVVLSGHTHERTVRPILEGRTIVVEPGSLGSFVGRLNVKLGAAGGIEDHTFELVPVEPERFPENPEVKALVDAALAPYRARSGESVAQTNTPVMRYDVLETSADNLVADAVREATGAQLGVTNGFRFAPPIPPGPITEGALWDLIPLDARLKKGWVTGAELRAYLEDELELVFSDDPWKLSGGWGPRISGLSLVFEAHAPPGKRLRDVSLAGAPLEDARRYTLGGCERDGEPLNTICRLRGVHDAKVLPQTIHGALRAYLKSHPRVAPTREGRARATDLPERVFSQDDVLVRRPAGEKPQP